MQGAATCFFRSGQPEVHLSRFRESSVLGMTAELCRAVPVGLSSCDDAHTRLQSRCEVMRPHENGCGHRPTNSVE
jgi:hypothetical protein